MILKKTSGLTTCAGRVSLERQRWVLKARALAITCGHQFEVMAPSTNVLLTDLELNITKIIF